MATDTPDNREQATQRPDGRTRSGPAGAGRGGGLLRRMLPNVILPWAIYQLLTDRGVSMLTALIATGIVPLATSLYEFARSRRVDALGMMTLAFVVIGILTSFISGDPFFFLVKESLLTGVWGLVMLGSLLMARPLTFYFGRQFMSGGDPAHAAQFDAYWQRPDFRSYQRSMTVLWGAALLAEAALRVVLVYVLPIPVFLIVSPAMGIGVTILLVFITIFLGRRLARQRSERVRAVPSERAQDRPASA